MLHIYSIGIRIYGLIVLILSLYNTKASQWINGRKSQSEKIKHQKIKWADAPVIIIHAASYGEYEMSKPIIEELRKNIPKLKFIISFFSPSGYSNVDFVGDNDIAKIYLPLDKKKNQEKLIEILKPKAVIFIKYEFWFNLLKVLSENNIPYYYTSFHLNNNSYLFKKIAHPFLELIKNAKIIFAHNYQSHSILASHHINNVKILGDTRIDMALKNLSANHIGLQFTDPERQTMIIGSLTEEDCKMVTSYINSHPENNYIIAPHDIDSDSIELITNSLNRSYQLYTSMKSDNIIIINTLGDLKFLYRHANMAYIGGGFSKGPHNIIEPLVYGIKVFCGPNINKFPMAKSLKEKGLLNIIENKKSFSDIVSAVEKIDPDEYKQRSSRFISDSKSQIHLVVDEIIEVINEN